MSRAGIDIRTNGAVITYLATKRGLPSNFMYSSLFLPMFVCTVLLKCAHAGEINATGLERALAAVTNGFDGRIGACI